MTTRISIESETLADVHALLSALVQNELSAQLDQMRLSQTELKETIMATIEQLETTIDALKVKLDKVAGEQDTLLEHIRSVEAERDAAIAAGHQLPDSLMDKLNGMVAVADAMDGKVPDATQTPPTDIGTVGQI